MNEFDGLRMSGTARILLPLVIALEVIAPVLIIIGWQARYAAFALAGFSILSALLFHLNFADQTQSIMFMKNFAVAGGLLLLFSRKPVGLSLDKK